MRKFHERVEINERFLVKTLASLSRNLGRVGGSVLFAYLSLFFLQAKVLWGVWQNWDLPLWDGATYFIYAHRVADSFIFPQFTWSPVFAAYYALFHAVFGSSGPFMVYLTHRVVMLFLVLGLLYGLLRAVLPAGVAWILAACSIVLSAGLTNNFVVHLFVLIPLLVAYRSAISRSSYRNGIILIGLMGASLVRTEFLLALLLVSIMLIGLDWRRSRAGYSVAWRKTYVPALLGGALFAVLVLRAGSSHTPLDRSWGAFEQHYAWGYQERHPEWNVDFWFKYDEAIQRSFGNAKSIGEAVTNNPLEMLTHVIWNVRVLPDAVGGVFSPLPGAEWVLLIMVLGGVGLIVRGTNYRLERHALTMWRFRSIVNHRYTLLTMVIACTWLPLIMSTLLIRPRTIYMLSVLPVVLLIIGAGLAALLSRLNLLQPALGLLPILFGVCLIVFPAPYNQPGNRVVMPTVDALKNLPIAGDYALLGPSARGFCAYSNPTRCMGIEILSVPSKIGSFVDYLSDARIQVIIVNKQVADNLPLSGQTFIANLQAAPMDLGWQDAGVIGPFHLYWRSAISSAQ